MNSPEGADNRATIVVAGLRHRRMDVPLNLRWATGEVLEGTMLDGLWEDL